MLKTGFSMIGGVLATGINKGGQWLDGKIDKNENPSKVSDETKGKLNTIKEKTTSTMKVAGFYLDKIFSPVAEYTNQVITDVSTKID